MFDFGLFIECSNIIVDTVASQQAGSWFEPPRLLWSLHVLLCGFSPVTPASSHDLKTCRVTGSSVTKIPEGVSVMN